MPADGGNWMTKSQLQCNPALDDFLQLPAAVFQGFAGCPYALQLGHLAIKGLRVIDDLVGGLIHCCLDVLCEHRNNIHGNQIKPFASLHLLIYLLPGQAPVHMHAGSCGWAPRIHRQLINYIWSALSHSSRLIPDRFKIFLIRSTPISSP
jgi:hypothetical protein